jgi:Spy/CpxP family protein refolding chaperone
MRPKYFVAPLMAIVACTSLQAETSEPATSPNPSYGEDGHWRHHHAWIWRKLNLTDTQKQDIKEYRTKNRTAFRSALASYLSARQALLVAIKSNAATQPAASELATAEANLATAEANLMALRVKQEQYIARPGFLVGDQVTTWQNFQAERTARIQERINKLNQANP